MEIYRVAFFGHRYLEFPLKVEKSLEEKISELLEEKEYIEFLVGRNGEFDILVARVIKRMKKEKCSLNLFLPYLTAEYINNYESFEEYYDNIKICEKSHPKGAILKRNKEMVNRADEIICFVGENKGGAYKTIKYVKEKNKKITNLAD